MISTPLPGGADELDDLYDLGFDAPPPPPGDTSEEDEAEEEGDADEAEEEEPNTWSSRRP